MQRYTRSQLSDPALIQSALTHAGSERTATADLLADIAEIDDRRLYAPAGYASTLAWCVGELGLSHDAALRRITAARAARRFPAIFSALADGRLHLTAVGLLAPYLTEDTAKELLAAAAHRSKSEIERQLAERFPKTDVLAWVEDLSTVPAPTGEPAPAHVRDELVPERVETLVELAPGKARRPNVKPLTSESFQVQFTLSRKGHDRLRYVQELLSHEIPTGDPAAVFEKLLELVVPLLEMRKFAATEKPRPGQRRSAADSRHIPDHVRRAVWERDGGRCTFVSDSGHRCQARKFVEFDHIDAFARGGEATVDGIRLLCRAHNQFEAERTFGAEFMRRKRIAAAEARAAAEQAAERDVVPWLRALGFSIAEARRAAERCEDIPDAPLEERVRIALSSLARGARVVRSVTGLETAAPAQRGGVRPALSACIAS